MNKFIAILTVYACTVACTMSRNENNKSDSIEKLESMEASKTSYISSLKDKKCIKTHLNSSIKVNNVIKVKYGYVECGNEESYSLITFSSNNGNTWSNVGPYYPFSKIEVMKFISENVGFAVASHFVEGPGPEFLLKTENAGKSWNEVLQIKKEDGDHLMSVANICNLNDRLYIKIFRHLNSNFIYYKTDLHGKNLDKVSEIPEPCK